MRTLPVAAAALAALAAMPMAHAADLSAIYALARANDAQFSAAARTAEALREKSPQGKALLLPTVGINGSGQENHGESSNWTGYQNYPSGVLNLQATQPLVRPANWASYEQGELQAQLADQQFKLAEQELLMRVSRGYFEVLQAQDALGTVGAQRQAFTQQLAQAKRSYEVGLAPVTDVNEAQSRYDLTVAQEIAARNDLEVKRRTLEKAINRELPPLARLDPAVSIEFLSSEQLLALADSASQSATQVAIGVTNQKIAQQEISKQNAGHLPTLDLVGNLGRTRNENFVTSGANWATTSSIGVTLAIPLYQGGAISSKVREAVANVGRAEDELENARRQATLDARQALLGVQTGVALDKALRQAVSSSETQVRSTRRGLEVGLRTRVDVLNAEQQLYTTRRDLSAARYQALISALQLKAAAGTITEQDLKTLDALLRE